MFYEYYSKLFVVMYLHGKIKHTSQNVYFFPVRRRWNVIQEIYFEYDELI